MRGAIVPVSDLASQPDDLRVALVLGGGNALGAYHAGVYQALEEAGIEPDWIVGTSIGAVVGAIIAGNRREDRLDRLRRLWRPADKAHGWPMPWDMVPENWRRTGAVLETLLAGRGGMFGPLGSSSSWWSHDRSAGSRALYDTKVLRGTLSDLLDFDVLNGGAPRFTAAALDVESGEEVWLDTARQKVTADHIRASAALLSTFPAVSVDGRLLGDGGLSMNLPLDPVMDWNAPAPVLCIAADLLPLTSGRPRTLGEVIGRTQDLVFAAQTRRTIEHWKRVHDRQAGDEPRPSITLVNLAYSDQAREVAGKAMDFSPRSVRERWDTGQADGADMVARLRRGDIATGKPGLTVASTPGAKAFSDT